MKILELHHETLGLCAVVVVTPAKREHNIKHDWKKKYGKQMIYCTIKVIDDDKKPC